MSGDKKRASLAADIAAVISGRQLITNLAGSEIPTRCLLVTGVALAIMQSQPAQALSLGELRVQSGLGQPFVGTTTARLGPGETLTSACMSAPGTTADELGSPPGLTISAQSGTTPGTYPVQLRTTQPLYEPMYEIRLQVDCPGGVALSKSYVVMLNLPMSAPVNTVSAPASRRQAANEPASGSVKRNPTNRPARASANNRLAPSRGSIPAGQPYRVRNGDTLSTIAERIEGRPVGSTWRVAEILFSGNPRAFIRGDRDMLKLGALLNIPGTAALRGEDASNSTAPAYSAGTSDVPAASADQQPNVTLGRPEESATQARSTATGKIVSNDAASDIADMTTASDPENQELLRAIREANRTAAEASQNNAAPNATEELSPFADDSATASTGPAVAVAPDADIQSSDPVAMDSAAKNSAQENTMNPIMAAFAGILMGVLLALVMLGRGLLAPLIAGRARRKAALQPVAAASTDDAQQPEKFQTVEVGAKPARPAYGGGGIDVEIGSPAPAIADEPATAPANTPRISLRSEDSTGDMTGSTRIESLLEDLDDNDDNNDKTARFEAPRLNTPLNDTLEQGTASTENTGTMRSLFEEGSDISKSYAEASDSDAETVEMPDESESATAELPAVESDDVADIDITDLESLSRQLQETQDDKLSATLTQALGLLEQDYEEEMTASQILEQKEVDDAFSQHKAED